MPQPQNGQRQQALAELAARSRVQEARQRAKALCMSRPLGLDRGREIGELRSGGRVLWGRFSIAHFFQPARSDYPGAANEVK